MAEHQDREHYIPLRKHDLLELLCRDRGAEAGPTEPFRRLCQLLSATFHFEYHDRLEQLKNFYAPFDPDATTKRPAALPDEDRAQKLEDLFGQFTWLMERANFIRLDRAAIEQAMKDVSAWGLNMEVDFNVFEKLEIFVRGDTVGSRSRRRWQNLYRLETVPLPVYQRLVLIVKLKPSKRLPAAVDTQTVFLKLFKEIPKMDLEMLLPGARTVMPGVQRLKLGGSVASGLALIGYNIIKQILTTAALGVGFFWGPLFAVLGYGYRQYHGYQSAKTTFSLQLTQSLYYQNLDNNAGVLTALLDEAEEQECREAMLAYYYLWRHPRDDGWGRQELDDYVENDLERLAKIKVDLEIDDAMAKLERLHLVHKTGDRYHALPIDQALENLDRAWDNYFKYSDASLAPSNGE